MHAATTAVAAAASASATGASSSSSSSSNKDDKDAPKHLDWRPDASALTPLAWAPLSGSDALWTNVKLAFALPWCVASVVCPCTGVYVVAFSLHSSVGAHSSGTPLGTPLDTCWA
jgi:hypothetical protein